MHLAVENMLATALAHLEAGRFDLAEELCRPILAERPNDIVALQCAAFAVMRAGRPDQAVPFLQRATKAKRGDTGLLSNLGVALKTAGRLEEAVKVYRKALKGEPNSGQTWFNLGNALKDMKRHDEAEVAYRRAIATENCGDGSAVYCNLGLLQEGRGDYDAAIASYQLALRARPASPNLHFNLGNALRGKLSLDEAIHAYDRALQLQPGYPDARLNQSLAFLLKGDFARGFAGFEARLDTNEVVQRGFRRPLWRGEPLSGRCLLLHAEQGYGDTIQFLRYLPELDRRGGRIVVEVPPALRRLVERKVEHDALGGIEILSAGDALPAFDFHLPFMSLPNVFGFDASAIPGTPPYLWADPVAVEHWRNRLAGDDAVRIGVVWAGSPTHRNDHNRSIKPAALRPLFDLSGGTARRFYSLQVDASEADLAAFNGSITDLAPFLHDFTDTAAVICVLDLIICVDTSVAHLAAALGQRVELLLPYNPDWRWLLERSDSPWYPTVHLNRQRSPGDWSSVVAALAAELRCGGRFNKQELAFKSQA